MKILKKIGISLLVIITFLLVVALFVSREFNYEKSITINKPIDQVWEHTNSLSEMDRWSPWNDYDPNMKKELSGVDGTIGAKSSWESDNKNVGKGSQAIAEIEEPTLFVTDLKFYTPFESEAKGFVKLKSQIDKTIVTWGFKSEMPYPFNLMKLIMNMEESMEKDFKSGLTKLKNICEQE